MSHTSREVVPNQALYVFNASCEHRQLFESESEYYYLLHHVRLLRRRYQVLILGWCLLKNDIHLVLRPPGRRQLALFMQVLSTRHAWHVNRRRGEKGPIWQGRFRSRMLRSDRERVQALKRVESLPWERAATRQPGLYPWCSLQERMRAEPGSLLVHDQALWRSDDPDQEACRRAWRSLLLEEAVPGATVDRMPVMDLDP